MKNIDRVSIECNDVVSITCDRCQKEFTKEKEVMEFQEFVSISFVGGYGSIFGDGDLVEGDFCQRCVKEVLGKHLRVTNGDRYAS